MNTLRSFFCHHLLLKKYRNFSTIHWHSLTDSFRICLWSAIPIIWLACVERGCYWWILVSSWSYMELGFSLWSYQGRWKIKPIF